MKRFVTIALVFCIALFAGNVYGQQTKKQEKVKTQKEVKDLKDETKQEMEKEEEKEIGKANLDSREFARITPLKLEPGRYSRSFQSLDGTIHLMGLIQIIEQGSRVVLRDKSDPAWGLSAFNESRINSFFLNQGFFLGLGSVGPVKDGMCVGQIWRSFDDNKIPQEEQTHIIVLEAGQAKRLVFHRGMLKLSDGSLLTAMYGSFEQDTLRPSHPWSKMEAPYKDRSFVVRSTDQGKTWYYYSSLAVPNPKQAYDDSEGFKKWTSTRLHDVRLLAVIRTGHFTPLMACWSKDEGRNWTSPILLDCLGQGGADPYLLKLNDGRLLLAYGQMV